MFECLIWCHTLTWIHNQALLHEVSEVRVLVAHHQVERLTVSFPVFTSAVLVHDWVKLLYGLVILKKLRFSLGYRHDIFSRHTNHLDYSAHLVVL